MSGYFANLKATIYTNYLIYTLKQIFEVGRYHVKYEKMETQKIFFKFIHFLEREREEGRAEREGERENQCRALRGAQTHKL